MDMFFQKNQFFEKKIQFTMICRIEDHKKDKPPLQSDHYEWLKRWGNRNSQKMAKFIQKKSKSKT